MDPRELLDLLLDEGAVIRTIAGDTAAAIAAVDALRAPEAPEARRLAAVLPLLPALAIEAPPQVEHDPPAPGAPARPLLEHARRALDRLAAVEARDLDRFQRAPALSPAAFARAADAVDRVRDLLPAVRLALLHLDVAKGGDAATRAAWEARAGDLAIHNLAAARLVDGAPWATPLVRALIASHGVAGQALRGECSRAALAPFVAAARGLDPRAVDALHVVNVVDTAAVRDGLLDDDLLAGFEAIRDDLARAVTSGRGVLDDPGVVDAGQARRRLADRLARLRGARQRAGEPRADVDAAVAALADDDAVALTGALAACQLWYAEAATAGLSPAAQLRVLAAACGAARRAGIDVTRPWHAQLRPLVARLHGDAPAVRYRRRIVEAVLSAVPVARLLAGVADGGRVLAALDGVLGDDRAIVVDLRDSEEAAALLTLLTIYEARASARFHATLKALCDLYGLRQDDLDRVANEADYLARMNASRDDKARMLEVVRPGRIVEIGPGGGVVLDLLEDRFPDSEVIGLDLSREVIAALAARRARDGRRWRVIEGDARALAEHLGGGAVDTVVFCSVLHEIFSYGGFRLEPVRDVVRAAYDALAPGGRLVIRDGVAPPPGTRRLRLVAPDARDTLHLFAAQFEGLPITWRDLPDGRVELDAHAAMEFLYTYTWGPASFPYEVRERYGVLPYDAYVETLLGWLPGAHALPLPGALRSYLQPGYVEHLAGKIELTDEHDRAVPLPDSNCLIVIERG